jgi:hypothetical protein
MYMCHSDEPVRLVCCVQEGSPMRDHAASGPTSSEEGANSGGISAMGLVAVGFFWVSGGSYGNEGLVLSAPPEPLLFGKLLLSCLLRLAHA